MQAALDALHLGIMLAGVTQDALKGVCVAKTECEAKSCCCDLAGTKSSKLQSECSAAKGSCVKKDLCPK